MLAELASFATTVAAKVLAPTARIGVLEVPTSDAAAP